jgi:hypothetical protein
MGTVAGLRLWAFVSCHHHLMIPSRNLLQTVRGSMWINRNLIEPCPHRGSWVIRYTFVPYFHLYPMTTSLNSSRRQGQIFNWHQFLKKNLLRIMLDRFSLVSCEARLPIQLAWPRKLLTTLLSQFMPAASRSRLYLGRDWAAWASHYGCIPPASSLHYYCRINNVQGVFLEALKMILPCWISAPLNDFQLQTQIDIISHQFLSHSKSNTIHWVGIEWTPVTLGLAIELSAIVWNCTHTLTILIFKTCNIR